MIIFFEVKDPGEAKEIRARGDVRYLGITPEGKEQWQCTDGKIKYFLLPDAGEKGREKDAARKAADRN